MNIDLAQRICQSAASCGFDKCGIIPLEALDGFEQRLQDRMDKVPSSKELYQGMAGTVQKTREKFPWAKSIVVCSFFYGKFRYPASLRGKYAKDYLLNPEPYPNLGFDLQRFEASLEAEGVRFAGGRQFGHGSVAPLRYAAIMAGIGIVRKNNFFYTEQDSYNRLIGYVIDQECELIHECSLKPCSDSCDLCMRACKTCALSAPYTFDPFKCVSFLTTFGKGAVPPPLTEAQLEEWMCGCDNCQDACPYNQKHNWDEGIEFPGLGEIAPELQPERILEHTDEYLAAHVIPLSDNHLRPSEANVLRENAKRVLRNRS